MKNQLKFLLLLLGVSFFILPGCKKDHNLKRTATTFTLTLTGETKPGTFTGYFNASGDPTISGTFTMDVAQTGDSLHCSQTLVSSKGSTTIISDCSLVTNTGAWYITTGTDAYSNLRGEGDLLMSFPENSLGIEALSGYTWRQ